MCADTIQFWLFFSHWVFRVFWLVFMFYNTIFGNQRNNSLLPEEQTAGILSKLVHCRIPLVRGASVIYIGPSFMSIYQDIPIRGYLEVSLSDWRIYLTWQVTYNLSPLPPSICNLFRYMFLPWLQCSTRVFHIGWAYVCRMITGNVILIWSPS